MIEGKTHESCNKMPNGHQFPEHFENVGLVSFCYQVAYACIDAIQHGAEQDTELGEYHGVVAIIGNHLQGNKCKNEKFIATV